MYLDYLLRFLQTGFTRPQQAHAHYQPRVIVSDS